MLKITARALALYAGGLALCLDTEAQAQSLPLAPIGSAQLVSPTTSDTPLGASLTHTNSLSAYSYLGRGSFQVAILVRCARPGRT
jgi:hypothetical protein